MTAEHSMKYEKIRPKYELLVKEVSFALEERFKSVSLSTVAITGRAKEITSFEGKVLRKPYQDPLTEITDLAGVRVVCNYESEIGDVTSIIKSEFNIHEEIDKASDLGIEKMGYNGKHFIVSFGSSASGARYNEISNLKCEIQVRTILQDAWALISHHLIYKEEASIPSRLRREINNLASLLEIAQSVVESVKEKREAYLNEITQREQNTTEFLSQPVDFETMSAYSKWKFPYLPVSPTLNDRLVQKFSRTYPKLEQIDAVVESTVCELLERNEVDCALKIEANSRDKDINNNKVDALGMTANSDEVKVTKEMPTKRAAALGVNSEARKTMAANSVPSGVNSAARRATEVKSVGMGLSSAMVTAMEASPELAMVRAMEASAGLAINSEARRAMEASAGLVNNSEARRAMEANSLGIDLNSAADRAVAASKMIGIHNGAMSSSEILETFLNYSRKDFIERK